MDNSRIYYVYTWSRPDTKQVFYVGKGHGNRINQLKSRNVDCISVVQQFGLDSILKHKIKDHLTEQEAFDLEVSTIAYYSQFGELTNKNRGGLGSGDWYDYLSEEQKENHRNVSKSFLGKHHTESTKQKMSEHHKGKKHNMTEEGKRRLRESAQSRIGYWNGKHLSNETKEKLRNARLNTIGKNGKPVIVINDSFKIVNKLRSRQASFDNYTSYNHSEIRKMLESNSVVSDINDVVFIRGLSFIYEINYNQLVSASTIETVLSDEADKRTE